jgi:anti-sigma factor ChrR (cupin superfamily)
MTAQATIVNLADLPMEDVRRGRVHMIRRKRLPLDSGLPGVTMEYSYSIVPEGYFTPRHRHNFDQIRYTISGIQSTGHGDLAPGECGYFPEGAYYGPQKQVGECHCLVLQFQGASGEHLLSNEEMNETHGKLLAAGAEFKDGVCTFRRPDGHRINKDSYEAIWEAHEGRELVFPPPRYRDPVMMVADRYRWVADRRRPGVETKHLGTFTELRTGIGFMRLRPGATLPAARHDDLELLYLLDGSVRHRGRTWGKDTYVRIPGGAETEPFHSETGATFFTLALPMVGILAEQRQHGLAAE